MKLVSAGRTVAMASVATLIFGSVVTACGSDDDGGVSTSASGGAAGRESCLGKDRLTAEGSTAQQKAMALFNTTWGQLCPGKQVSYEATGSGVGREQFIAGHVDFAGSDSPLVAEQLAPAADRCGGNPAWDLPLSLGPIAIVYNLADIPDLVVDSDALAKIFSGGILRWDDPTLAALNPGVKLPGTTITPIYREDSSGTTDNFQKYLTAAAPQSWTWGVGIEFQGGVGEGAQRSAGVIEAVRSTPGAIGYVGKSSADHASIPFARLETGKGVVRLTEATAGNAIRAVTVAGHGNDLVLELTPVYTAEDPKSYPLVLASYEIVCSKGYDGDTAAAIKSFLTAAAGRGQEGLSAAGYLPLPDKVKERLVAAIDALR
ncbi:phosphate ABC transporter substrate-binding protein PstS [Mycobacterium sp.]|uniref:phosphate ABC transporter substrate-binding protein PstS n=1 Tax=Mycobacterium sp. TaxID=1785 RepID=UPI003A8931A8